MDGPRRRTRTGDPSTQLSAAAARSAEPLAAVDPAAFPDRETRRAIDGGAASARFRDLLAAGGPVIADGAMGTMLFQNGLQFGDPPEVWNLTQPEIIRRIQRGYLDAGSQIIMTNTFGGTACGSPCTASRHGSMS